VVKRVEEPGPKIEPEEFPDVQVLQESQATLPSQQIPEL